MFKVTTKKLLMGRKVISILLSLMFAMAAMTKLTGNPAMADNFVRWGFPVWFMYVVGSLELLGVIGLWVKQVRMWAALGLALLMVAALRTHILHDPANMMILPGVLFLLAGKLTWINKRLGNEEGTPVVEKEAEPTTEEPTQAPTEESRDDSSEEEGSGV